MFIAYVIAVIVTILLIYWINRTEREIKRIKRYTAELDKSVASRFNQLSIDLNNPKANIVRISNALTQLAKDQKP